MDRKKFTKEVNKATYFTVLLFFSLLLVKNKKKHQQLEVKLKMKEQGNSLFNDQKG